MFSFVLALQISRGNARTHCTLQCKSKSTEVTGPRSEVLQFSISDERNKMVLTDKEKAVVENAFNEKGWNAYKIWKENPSFG